jgi:hypothetical protein
MMENRIQRVMLTVVIATGLLAAGAWAADEPAPDSGQMPQAEAQGGDHAPDDLTIRVTQVTGQAEYRTEPDAAWQPVTEGMALPLGAMVRTGLKSDVALQAGPNARFEVGSLSQFAVADMQITEGGKVLRTRAGMPYGQVDFDVKHVGYTNDMQIATSSGVMSVKGTKGQFQAFGSMKLTGDPGNRANAIVHTSNTGKTANLSGAQVVGKGFANPKAFANFQNAKRGSVNTMMNTKAARRMAAGPGAAMLKAQGVRQMGNTGVLRGQTRAAEVRQNLLKKIKPGQGGGD